MKMSKVGKRCLPRLAASVEISKSMWFRMSRPVDAAFSKTMSSTVPTVPLVAIAVWVRRLQTLWHRPEVGEKASGKKEERIRGCYSTQKTVSESVVRHCGGTSSRDRRALKLPRIVVKLHRDVPHAIVGPQPDQAKGLQEQKTKGVYMQEYAHPKQSGLQNPE